MCRNEGRGYLTQNKTASGRECAKSRRKESVKSTLESRKLQYARIEAMWATNILKEEGINPNITNISTDKKLE